jgi:hypothetical protein
MYRNMRSRQVPWNQQIILFCVLVMVFMITLSVSEAFAVGGASFTTFNAHVDGQGKDVCKNSAINCNIYGAKEYVWLNGGPDANGLKPDGEYFFAVLEPGGQPNPNDQGGVLDKNLSDDYDAYTNRTFTVTDGEVSAYDGTHWLDSGHGGHKPNGDPPYIRLFPYSDTTNPGGVYILAICSLEDGYPVEPRDCKYDAFKVQKGKMKYSFFLSGMKFEDLYADGFNDNGDPGLPGWTIAITGTGPDGYPIDEEVYTDEDGYWEYQSQEYTFNGGDKPLPVDLEVCEVLQDGWTQSYPTPECYSVNFTPTGFYNRTDLNFGNWYPVDVTACKVQDLDGEPGGETVPVSGWPVSLTEYDEESGVHIVVNTQTTGDDGCYTWYGLTPGISYDVHEGSVDGWEALGDTDVVFERAKSGDSFSHIFANAPLQGCTPGFWQGGPNFEQAGGRWLWNEENDPDWGDSGGLGTNPFVHLRSFCSFFGCGDYENIKTMWYFINPDMWDVNDDFHKAARALVAAYLNASWGINYPYTTDELIALWVDALSPNPQLYTLSGLHIELDAANNAYYRTGGGPHCPISASLNGN